MEYNFDLNCHGDVIFNLKEKSYNLGYDNYLKIPIMHFLYQRQESKPDDLQKLAIKIGEVPKRQPPKKSSKPKQQKEKQSKTNSRRKLPQLPRRIPK